MSYEFDENHDHNHDHEMEIDVEEQMGRMQADFAKHLKKDEENLRLAVDLAKGKNKWKKLLDDRIEMLDEIIEWNNDSLDPLQEIYEMYLEESSDDTMMQFSVLESRRLLMRDFCSLRISNNFSRPCLMCPIMFRLLKIQPGLISGPRSLSLSRSFPSLRLPGSRW